VKELTRRVVGLNMIMGLGSVHAARGLGDRLLGAPEPRMAATPVQASGLPSNFFGVWKFEDDGTDGSNLHIQRMVVTINSDTSGEVDFATQVSEIGGNGCTTTSTGIFPGGNWFVNGPALSLNVPRSTFTNVFSCTPGQNSTSHGLNGVFTFHTFVVNGDTAVATPPSDLNIHAFEAPGAPLATSIILHRIAGSSAPTTLFAAVLPSSRSVQVGKTATAFATIINPSSGVATSCAITPATTVPATFLFQTTDPNTNKLTGSPNAPVDIPGNGKQSFLIAFNTTSAFNPTDVVLAFTTTNTGIGAAPTVTGLNTLLLSASPTPVPDIVALAATTSNDGTVHVPGSSGTGFFAVATVNVGASSTITATANTGNATLPLSINLCQTDPQSGQCISATGPSVTFQDNAGATPTVAVFVTASGDVPFIPQSNRIFVDFSDPGGVVRGSTSVAVTTQ
jgi:hypothetical protein